MLKQELEQLIRTETINKGVFEKQKNRKCNEGKREQEYYNQKIEIQQAKIDALQDALKLIEKYIG